MVHAEGGGVESRIERLHLEAAEGEYHLDFERSDSGWTRIEQDMDDEGYVTPEFTKTTVLSLSNEVRDHAAAYQTVTEIRVKGVTPAEMLAWIRPLLDPDQDSITINDESLELFDE